MTNEEAISVLNDYDINFERHTPEEVAEAHEMAIEALGEQPSKRTEERTEMHACDCISREAVLELVADYNLSMGRVVKGIHNLPSVTPQPSEDCISRQAAINALWKALYEYEDKTENQFLESKELDVADWFQHRIFVQNMSDIDRQTILNLPSVAPQPNTEQIIKSTIKEYIDKDFDKNCDDVIELLLALNKDLCERIRKENEDGTY